MDGNSPRVLPHGFTQQFLSGTAQNVRSEANLEAAGEELAARLGSFSVLGCLIGNTDAAILACPAHEAKLALEPSACTSYTSHKS